MYDDMYALEDFIRERHLEAHRNRVKCEHNGIPLCEERYASQEYAYQVVLNKIESMRVNQWPRIKQAAYERDIDYVL